MSPPRGSAGPFLPLLSRISPSLPETEFLFLSPPAPNFPGAQITDSQEVQPRICKHWCAGSTDIVPGISYAQEASGCPLRRWHQSCYTHLTEGKTEAQEV